MLKTSFILYKTFKLICSSFICVPTNGISFPNAESAWFWGFIYQTCADKEKTNGHAYINHTHLKLIFTHGTV